MHLTSLEARQAPVLTAHLHDRRPRPVAPRRFGRREFEKLDVYGFFSVKEQRAVEVAGLAVFSTALKLECHPETLAYVERPRHLQVAERTVELDFWTLTHTGREEFILVIPDAACRTIPGGVRAARDAELIANAAWNAGINVRLVTEFDIRVDGQRTIVRNRLLVFSQLAQSLDNNLAIRSRLSAYFAQIERARIDQVEEALRPIPAPDLHAVICELVCLGLLAFDLAHGLTRHTLIEWRAAR